MSDPIGTRRGSRKADMTRAGATGGGGGYSGPGDIVSLATGWWGLRAYSAASIGSNVVTIRRSSDSTTKTFVSITGGGINTSDAFFDGSNYFVTTLFDQTGNGNNLVQATSANQPGLSLAGGISSLPVITFVSGTSYLAIASFGTTVNQPFSVSHIANIASLQTRDLFRSAAGDSIIGYNQTTGANSYTPFAGSFLIFTASDGSYHAIQSVFNSSSSAFMIDGSDNTAQNPGTDIFCSSGDTIYLNDVPQATSMDCSVEEIGVWPVAFSSGQRISMNSNQHTYWGF